VPDDPSFVFKIGNVKVRIKHAIHKAETATDIAVPPASAAACVRTCRSWPPPSASRQTTNQRATVRPADLRLARQVKVAPKKGFAPPMTTQSQSNSKPPIAATTEISQT